MALLTRKKLCIVRRIRQIWQDQSPRFDKDKAVRQNDNIAVTEYHMLAFQLERKQSVAKLPTFHKPTSNQTSKRLIRHEIRIVLQFVTKYFLRFRQILTQNL
ncbi:hypothetical protein WN48_01650 [Eufriesea mexicana]|uniref:Uncharacterized protein n=1 Tax=Eufriesea mexicana TaxID=516756 RepID=A0A310SR67_9HYME|nr:hypothetical protein WN48_01650 [Eufriesea mexicana]